MGIYGKARSKDFTPAPEGLHRAVCCDVVNLGMVDGTFGRKHMINLVFQIEERIKETGKPFLVQKRYTLSMHKKANLRRDVESWFGKKFASDDQAEAFDLEKVIGQNAQVNVSQRTTDAGTFANIEAIVPAVKGMAALRVEDYERKCNRPDWQEPVVEENGDEGDYNPPQNLEADDEPVPF